MTLETLFNTINAKFTTDISTPLALPTIYDNEVGDSKKPDTATWVRLTILPGEAFLHSIGATKTWRIPGVFIAQIFVPIGQGAKPAAVIADAINTAFRSKAVNGVTYRTPRIITVGTSGKWWQFNVTCPFHADHTGS